MTCFRKEWQDEIPVYTGCPRRKGQYFGRVFLMLNYTEKTKTPVSELIVTEIMAREV
jgi:hypothetical protein